MSEQKIEKTTTPVKEKTVKHFSGVVVNAKGNKTIAVEVEAVKMNKKYRKRYTVSRNYQVHDEKNVCKEGDKVTFIECRPLSKTKRWRVTDK
ncbi:MAG: 30S ribosomal protein S17 [Patescibacteria group bacterium]|nr:30S ribosomal protein S17 [Patescibacteria group bacterium]